MMNKNPPRNNPRPSVPTRDGYQPSSTNSPPVRGGYQPATNQKTPTPPPKKP